MSDSPLIIGARPEVREVVLDGLALQVFAKRGMCGTVQRTAYDNPQVIAQLTQHDLLLNHLVRDYETTRQKVDILEALVEKLTGMLETKTGQAIDFAGMLNADLDKGSERP